MENPNGQPRHGQGTGNACAGPRPFRQDPGGEGGAALRSGALSAVDSGRPAPCHGPHHPPSRRHTPTVRRGHPWGLVFPALCSAGRCADRNVLAARGTPGHTPSPKGGRVGGLATPQRTPPPARPQQKNYFREKMKRMKGPRNWRPSLRDTALIEQWCGQNG